MPLSENKVKRLHDIVLIVILICIIVILSAFLAIKANVIISDPYSNSAAFFMQIFMVFIGLLIMLCFLQFGLYLKIKEYIKINSRKKYIIKSVLSILLFVFGFILLFLLLFY